MSVSLQEEAGFPRQLWGFGGRGSLAEFQFTEDETESQRSSMQLVTKLEFEIRIQVAGPQLRGR